MRSNDVSTRCLRHLSQKGREFGKKAALVEKQIFSPDSNDLPARKNLMHKKFCIKFGKFDAWI
jgi:hypothetical protein